METLTLVLGVCLLTLRNCVRLPLAAIDVYTYSFIVTGLSLWNVRSMRVVPMVCLLEKWWVFQFLLKLAPPAELFKKFVA
ncbi:hypothetical protein Hanom_Chr04g00359951 [Helianthus anomalus]